jgi:phospholipase C
MQIEHIVVLMLENRSFDHMLGYLRLKSGRTDIDGLTGNEINYYQGVPYKPQRMLSTTLSPNPCHDWNCVQQQLAHGNGGFIQNYATCAGRPTQPELVMNYYNAQDLPVFDHLPNQFCVCDRWFSSLPGPIHPTRAYALAGESAGMKQNSGVPAGIFNIPTIFDLLPDTVTWRYYSHDIAFLRSFDKYLLDLGPIDKVE